MSRRFELGFDRRRVFAFTLGCRKEERPQRVAGEQKYAYLQVISIDPRRLGVSSSTIKVEITADDSSEQYKKTFEHLNRHGVAISPEIAAGIGGPLMSRLFRGSVLAQIDFTNPPKAESELNFLLGFNRKFLLEEKKEGQVLSAAPTAKPDTLVDTTSEEKAKGDDQPRFFLYPVPAKDSFRFGGARLFLFLEKELPDYLK
ncbi:MAG: hypothetical protein WC624_02000 [Candidatus Margulisiibacteriota bacterium]